VKIQGKSRAVFEAEKAQADLDAERAAILVELDALSRRIPRHIEDLYELTGGYPRNVNAEEARGVTKQKLKLRERLRDLDKGA